MLKRKLTMSVDGESKIPHFLASHDSATGMVMALSDFLKGKPFEGVGAVPTNELYATFINTIPITWRKKLYSWIGAFSATSGEKAGDLDASLIDKWVFDLYPKRKYPAIAIGSSNGAMVHFCAAMGIPWLPQTFLVPMDKENRFPVDEPKKTMEWARGPAKEFLENNVHWQLHHMMDPNQDRLRVDSVGYFRIKKLALGEWYEKFISERLAPGGRLIIIDCEYQWPVSKMGDRHYFQFGGAGGLKPEEYYNGSPAVTEFLNEVDSKFEKWDAPVPDTVAPEAEWGLAKALAEDITAYAKKLDVKHVTITFDHPQDISAAVAEVYKSWYRENNIKPERLLVESFNMISPYLSISKNCIPFWLYFIVNDAAEDIENYLDNSGEFEEIYMMILSHGKYSKGSTPMSRWKAIMNRAKVKGDFIGTSPKEYPVDMAVYARYSKDLEKIVSKDLSKPEPLELDLALKLLEKHRNIQSPID